MSSTSSTNPWRFTKVEIDTLNCLCRVGEPKLIAREMKEPPGTIHIRIHRMLKKAGVTNRVSLALLWDRWKRGHHEEERTDPGSR